MSKLINADDFRRYVHEQLELNKSYTADEILEMIDEQPTAYDVDTVAEKLEKYATSTICDTHKVGCPYVDDDSILCENCGALGAIDIVKRGGVE